MRAKYLQNTLSLGVIFSLFIIFNSRLTLATSTNATSNQHNILQNRTEATPVTCKDCNDKFEKKVTIGIPKHSPKKILRKKHLVAENKNKKDNNTVSLNDLLHKVQETRKQCKLKETKSFYCQRVLWSWWFVKQLEQNTTQLTDYLQLIRRNDTSFQDIDDTSLMPEAWSEKLVFDFLKKWGEPVDQFVFMKFKKYLKSSEVKVAIPAIGTSLVVAPASHSSAETGRILFDPGFNLKMKLPFFREEMKFAVSTGPSFLAGLGIGMVMLGVKSMITPVMMAMKAMMMSFFFKDFSPFDLFRMLGSGPAEEAATEVQNVEAYEPPTVSNPYDNVLDKTPAPSGPASPSGSGITGYGPTGMGQNRPGPMFAYGIPTILSGPSGGYRTSPWNMNMNNNWNNMNQDWEDGRQQTNRPISAPSSDSINSFSPTAQESLNSKKVEPADSGFKYVPSHALQLEVENFDPFYSPLLSRIDSIFMHLGFTDEACRERAVCSIYKSPVKYAPYSNLLSLQLSKHQSELKRPSSSAPKVLRYFKYMKAAKDGQGSGNCIELYPKCSTDTDKPANLPMVKTFQHLTELMGSTARG